MLVKELYSIQNMDVTNVIKAELHIHAEHPVFKGHFPEVPVLPGVCMIQIMKELIEQGKGIRTTLKEADMIKFLSMMNPQVDPSLFVEIQIKEQTAETLTCIASMKNAGTVMLKYSGKLQVHS